MATVLLLLHIMIAVVLIGVVLLQRSEGGALGIGGGGGGGFMTGRGAANFLTRVTAGLAAGFFATSLFLSLVGARSEGPRSVLEAPTERSSRPRPDKPPGRFEASRHRLKNLPDCRRTAARPTPPDAESSSVEVMGQTPPGSVPTAVGNRQSGIGTRTQCRERCCEPDRITGQG